jgi:hypothetical protein
MEFADVIKSVIDEELANVIFPKSEREAASATVLIGEIQAVVVVADVLGTVPVVDTVVVIIVASASIESSDTFPRTRKKSLSARQWNTSMTIGPLRMWPKQSAQRMTQRG